MLSTGVFGREFSRDISLLEFSDFSMDPERSGALVKCMFLFLSFVVGEGERELHGFFRLVPSRFIIVGGVKRYSKDVDVVLLQ